MDKINYNLFTCLNKQVVYATYKRYMTCFR